MGRSPPPKGKPTHADVKSNTATPPPELREAFRDAMAAINRLAQLAAETSEDGTVQQVHVLAIVARELVDAMANVDPVRIGRLTELTARVHGGAASGSVKGTLALRARNVLIAAAAAGLAATEVRTALERTDRAFAELEDVAAAALEKVRGGKSKTGALADLVFVSPGAFGIAGKPRRRVHKAVDRLLASRK